MIPDWSVDCNLMQDWEGQRKRVAGIPTNAPRSKCQERLPHESMTCREKSSGPQLRVRDEAAGTVLCVDHLVHAIRGLASPLLEVLELHVPSVVT